ncbi:hypothetical protein HK104_007182, partial [Borealophlyctis nickersoniae]
MGRTVPNMDTYEGHTVYEITAELVEQPSAFSLFRGTPRRATVALTPFRVYDPRLVPGLLHHDIRRWRSAPGATPCEYDLEVGATVMGPNDHLRFAYRIIVASESARKGVRLKKVTLTLREHHTVGEARCGDGSNELPTDRKGVRVRGTIELLKWEQAETAPEPEEGTFELAELAPRGKSATSHHHNYRNLSGGGGGGGEGGGGG